MYVMIFSYMEYHSVLDIFTVHARKYFILMLIRTFCLFSHRLDVDHLLRYEYGSYVVSFCCSL